MSFFQVPPSSYKEGTQFFFNVLLYIIYIPMEGEQYIPKSMTDVWYIEQVTAARPKVYYFARADDLDPDSEYEVECFPHSVIQIEPDGEICWQEMLDFDTEDPWAIELDIEEEEDEDDHSE